MLVAILPGVAAETSVKRISGGVERGKPIDDAKKQQIINLLSAKDDVLVKYGSVFTPQILIDTPTKTNVVSIMLIAEVESPHR